MNNLLSFSSLRLEVFSKDGVCLQTASGFVLEARKRYYIITNRHIVSGTNNPEAGQQDSVSKPSVLKAFIHIHGGEGEKSLPLPMGMRKRLTVPLYDDKEAPLWIESRDNRPHQSIANIVALPIPFDMTVELLSANTLGMFINTDSWSRLSRYWTKISALSISEIDTDEEYGPPDAVHIIGYPIGWAPEGPDRSSSAFWRTSFIASEFYEWGRTRSDVFFVDPCAPQGMTGSPVVGLKNDRLKLLGVYSDESTAEFGANAGYVWGAWLLKDLIPQGRQG